MSWLCSDFEPLKHRSDVPPREDIPRQEQHGKAIDRGGGRARDHVGGPGADRGRAGERAQPVARFGECSRHVHPRLLVAAQVVAEIGVPL